MDPSMEASNVPRKRTLTIDSDQNSELASTTDHMDIDNSSIVSSQNSQLPGSSHSTEPQRKKKRASHYKTIWKEEFPWISSNTDRTVECSYCNKDIDFSNAGKSALRKHDTSSSHIKKLTTTNPPKKITAKDIAIAEASIAYVMTKHNIAYNVIDDLTDVLKAVIFDSEIMQKIHLKRTKTTKIVENVLAPISVAAHVETITEHSIPYGCQMDASNLRGNRKLFPVVIFYWFMGLKFFVLDVVECANESANDMFNLLLLTLAKFGLPEHLFNSFNGDNATVNFAPMNSVYVYMKQKLPLIFKGRCFAHILHNGFKKSVKCLTFDVERVVLKVYSHFSRSAQRRERFADSMDEHNLVSFKKHVSVRFLSLTDAIKHLLKHWDRTVQYFLAEGSCDTKVASILFTELKEIDPLAKITLQFVAFLGKHGCSMIFTCFFKQ